MGDFLSVLKTENHKKEGEREREINCVNRI